MEDNAVQRPGAKVGVTIMTRVCPSIGSLAIAGMVAVAFAAAPVGLDYNFTLEIESAFAKGKGSGGKGGSKGSKGSKSSKSGGHGKSGDGNGLEEAGGKNGNAFGHEKARGNGHQKRVVDSHHTSHLDHSFLSRIKSVCTKLLADSSTAPAPSCFHEPVAFFVYSVSRRMLLRLPRKHLRSSTQRIF